MVNDGVDFVAITTCRGDAMAGDARIRDGARGLVLALLVSAAAWALIVALILGLIY
jgi:hypothetical protein